MYDEKILFWIRVSDSLVGVIRAPEYGGTGQDTATTLDASPDGYHDQPCSLTVTLPPLATLILEPIN